MTIGWGEELCKRLDRVAREDHSCIATLDERRRFEKNWKVGLSIQGPVGPMKSRSHCSEAVQEIFEIRREAGQVIDPAIILGLQISTTTTTTASQIRYVESRPPKLAGFGGFPPASSSSLEINKRTRWVLDLFQSRCVQRTKKYANFQSQQNELDYGSSQLDV